MTLIDNTDPLLADLKFADKTPAQQAQIDALIVVCSELIEKYCNRIFLAADYVEEKLDGNGENSVFIRNPPINSIAALSIRDYDSEELDFDANLFDYQPRIGFIFWKDLFSVSSLDTTNFLGFFPRGLNNVLISYNGGFTEVPAPIKFACADMIKSGFSPELGYGNIEFEKLGQYFYKLRKEQIDKTLLGHRRILRMYKLYRV